MAYGVVFAETTVEWRSCGQLRFVEFHISADGRYLYPYCIEKQIDFLAALTAFLQLSFSMNSGVREG